MFVRERCLVCWEVGRLWTHFQPTGNNPDQRSMYQTQWQWASQIPATTSPFLHMDRGHRRQVRTAISKSTIFSAKVLISLLKQNLYSPGSFAVKTKSPCRSFVPSMIVFSLGPTTLKSTSKDPPDWTYSAREVRLQLLVSRKQSSELAYGKVESEL